MKKLVAALVLLSLVGATMADIGPYGPALNRDEGDITLTFGMSRLLGNHSGSTVHGRLSSAVRDDIVVGAELFTPDTFDEIGLGVMAQAFFSTRELPVDLALHGALWVPDLGHGTVVLEGATLILVPIPRLYDVELYAAVGGQETIHLGGGDGSFEARVAGGILFRLASERASIFAEISEAGGTSFSFGLRVAIQ